MNTIFQQPKNTLPRITELYLYVSVDEEDGNEGIVGAPMGEIGCMPLVAADKARLSVLTPIAQAVADHSGMHIRLIKLTKREEVGFITPNKNATDNR